MYIYYTHTQKKIGGSNMYRHGWLVIPILVGDNIIHISMYIYIYHIYHSLRWSYGFVQ